MSNILGIVETWDYNINFWEAHKQLKLVFKDFYNSDKSKNKTRSSSVMWAIASVFDLESKIYKAPLKDKIKLVETEIIKDIGYFERNKELIDDLKDKYVSLTDSEAKRHLRAWEELMAKRTLFIKGLEYNLDNCERIDKLAGSTKKLFEEFDKIKEKLESESSSINYANTEDSFLEKEED